ncbi:cytochrome b/b6 domain-containing protein [Streptomyces sp. NPDC005423]|uniref:cytochrome b/b6 domain-containing protein n=1 Tax=Streptomyces sp. NPDC005423 TaxID=3155343 RepID=UPI00339E400A
MNPRRSTRTLAKPGRSAYGVMSAVVLLFIPVFVLVGGDTVRAFLNFGAGVLSLVSLTCSVIWGLVAQDRIFLNTRQRIVGQAVHRTTAVASIAFLLLHITTKIALDHTQLIAALIPFSLGFSGSAGLIGMGSLAGLLMIFVGITGALRSNFASPAPVAARWRAMHMLAYPAWGLALIHGLYSGRQAKPIFWIMYSLCLLGVMAALALRSAPRPVKRRIADRIMSVLGAEDRIGLDDLEASRTRATESALPGYDKPQRGAPPSFTETGANARVAPAPSYESRTQEPVNDYAAAYRTATPSGGQQSFAGQTARMDLPMDTQATTAVPRADTGGSASGSWPIPSPPPVGEAPPSAYDPLQDTGYNIPAYNGNPGAGGYGEGYVYNTGESNGASGTYNPNDTYNSGPATETTPGASYDFDAPGTGEPWNTPSGGFK